MNVTSNYKGVIFFSWGSMVIAETFPIRILKAFFESFRKLPYQILWKGCKEKLPKELDVPPNIHFEQWVPQSDILCHPNTKLFISHGGSFGAIEAIHCGVPRIGIPLFADQDQNLKVSEAMNIAIVIKLEYITESKILASMEDILNNSSYSKNAKLISQRFKDRPLSPLDTAIYWVEYVIRHKGAPHLRNEGAELAWFEYYPLDVAAIAIGIILTFVATFYYILSNLVHLYFSIVNRKR